MENTELRQRMKDCGLKHWQLADKLGISEATLVRWLRRTELPKDIQEKALIILTEVERR